MKYDVIIIGGGPAGLTAAIYASRANLKTIFIEKGAPGGKMVKTFSIENWSGDKKVQGHELSLRMFEHAKEFSAEYKYGDVINIKSISEKHKLVELNSGEIVEGKSIIIATGMTENIPRSIKNIEKFDGRGVSYCAICDGPLYNGEDTFVIGGGNSAIEESIYLSSVAKSVTIFVRKPEELVADKKAIEDIEKSKNVKIVWGEIKELIGDEKLEKAKVLVKGEEKVLEVKAVFPYIGFVPNTEFLGKLDITNKHGFIITNEKMETSVENIFAIGDVRVKDIRQIGTAVGDGIIAGKLVASKI